MREIGHGTGASSFQLLSFQLEATENREEASGSGISVPSVAGSWQLEAGSYLFSSSASFFFCSSSMCVMC